MCHLFITFGKTRVHSVVANRIFDISILPFTLCCVNIGGNHEIEFSALSTFAHFYTTHTHTQVNIDTQIGGHKLLSTSLRVF